MQVESFRHTTTFQWSQSHSWFLSSSIGHSDRLPTGFPSSTVTESLGVSTLQSRGMLFARGDVRGTYELRGRVRMQNPWDHLRIVLLSELVMGFRRPLPSA